ncbi:4Fe-4S binding protein [bacterium]|nr:4Fe-4S binding protein [bacterium]
MPLNLFLPHQKRSHDQTPSAVRRLCRALGPTWAAAPVRRAVQAACLLLFLALFLCVCWPYGSRHHADAMRTREVIEAEAFLMLDPLASVSAAVAARAWIRPLAWAGVLLAVCLVFPRGFCGWVCPFGTLIDVFDWTVGARVKRCRVARRGWWVYVRYYVLLAVLVAAGAGLLLTGFVAAIPLLTRGLAFTLGFAQLGVVRGWYLVPPLHAGHWLTFALFAGVFALGLLAPRFWCRHVCPTGAVFSLANALRLTERRVTSACIGCGKCASACPFDAIRPDFTTRAHDCTFCQTCGGVCPVGAITFVGRWSRGEWRAHAEATSSTGITRRAFAGAAVGAGAAAAALGVRHAWGAQVAQGGRTWLVRPPGSLPEAEFLRRCVRCGQCIKACPFNVLQPTAFEHGIEGLWTPRVVPDWAGCEPTCTNCGQVCPTGAIRALPLEEKRVARIGLAVVDEQACLPHAGREACQLCVDECRAAGYDAIEFLRVHVAVDENGLPQEGSGYAAPVVVADRCVGCGLCQMRCLHVNVHQRGLLDESAVVVEAGPGKEDRTLSGSYLALRDAERRKKLEQRSKTPPRKGGDSYLPDFLD